MPDPSPPPQSSAVTGRLPWPGLLLLSGAAFWTVSLELLPAGLLPSIRSDLDVGSSRVGLLVTVWAFVIATTSILLTRATRRFPRPLVLGGSLALVGVSTLLGALAPSYLPVLVSRLVAAMGHGLFWSVLMVYAVAIAPQGKASRAIAVVNAGPLLASAAGLPLGTALGGWFGWRPVLGGIAVAMLGVAVVLIRRLPRPGRETITPATVSPPEAETSTADVAGGPSPAVRTTMLACLGSLALVAHFLVFTFVAPLATDAWGLAPGDVSGVLLAFGGASAAGLLLAGAVPDHRAPVGLVATIGTLALVLGLLAVPEVGPTAVVAGVIVWGLLLGLLPPLLQTAVIGGAAPGSRTTAGAVLVATFNLGIALGSAVGALVLDVTQAARLPTLGAVVALVSALGVATVSRRGRLSRGR